MKNHIQTDYYRDVPLALKNIKAEYNLDDTESLDKFAQLFNSGSLKIGWPPGSDRIAEYNGRYYTINTRSKK